MRSIPISVIICAKNAAHTIARQLTALADQVNTPPFQVVIVDDASTDHTTDTVRTWIAAHGLGAITNLTLTHTAHGTGIPYARNTGIRHARGDLILFCDADDKVYPTWVYAYYRAASTFIVAGGPRTIAGAKPSKLTSSTGPVHTPYLPYYGCSNMATHRRILEQMRGFDESLPKYGFEDVDFCWRVQQAGYQLSFISDAKIHFTVTGNSASIRKQFMLGYGRVLMAQRYPAYDNHSYSATACLHGIFSAGATLVRTALSQRKIPRRQAGIFIAAWGRLAGITRYRFTGYPEFSSSINVGVGTTSPNTPPVRKIND